MLTMMKHMDFFFVNAPRMIDEERERRSDPTLGVASALSQFNAVSLRIGWARAMCDSPRNSAA